MQAMDFESKSADATGSVRPSMRILVIEDDKEAAKKFALLYRSFIDEMVTWYKSGMWDETTREIVELCRANGARGQA